MVFMPPGSAKSTYASILFPAWLLAQDPKLNIIAASHTAELAERFGRRVRNLITEHSHILGYGLAADSQAAGRWDTAQGGEYYAAGVRGPITGRRADIAIIDDPVKSREEADSDIVRERNCDWYKNDLYTRLKPHGRIIIIQTRWHESDLGGWLLDEQAKGGDKWEVVSLPAIAQANDAIGRAIGDPLWPEWQDGDALVRIRAAVGSRVWSALYQQNPTPDEGTYFQRAWFKRFKPEQKPAQLHVYGSSDYAVTEDGGDYTVHRVWGVDNVGDLWLLDGWRGQTTADIWIERQIDLIKEHKPHAWFGEGGVIARAIEPILRRRLTERKLGARLEWLPSIADKPTRARGFQARAAMGKVHLPEGIDGDLVLDEYLHFPAGKHDDEVDCVARGTLITMEDGAQVPIECVRIGQRVRTPNGNGTVRDARLTIQNAKVLRLTLADGRELIATPNHPIATDDGFVRMDMISLGGSVTTERSWSNLSFSTGKLIGAIQKAVISTIASIFKPAAGKDSYTGTSGKMRMGQFLAGWMSTTSMRTRAITVLRTLSVSLKKIIAPNTRLLAPSLASSWSISTEFAVWPRIGTNLRKDESGTQSTRRRMPEDLNHKTLCVAVAGAGSDQNTKASVCIVQPSAHNATESADRMRTTPQRRAPRSIAWNVANYFAGRIRSLRNSVTQSASSVIALNESAHRVDVFNLTIDGEHVFYANGILTHNCGSLIGRALDETHPAIIRREQKSANPSDLNQWRRERTSGEWKTL